MPNIARDYSWLQVTLTSSQATTPDIPMSGYAFGEIYIPTGSSITSLTYYACPRSPGGDTPVPGYTDRFDACQDSTGTAVTQTVAADKCYPLPTAIAGCGVIRIKANAAGVVQIGFKG